MKKWTSYICNDTFETRLRLSTGKDIAADQLDDRYAMMGPYKFTQEVLRNLNQIELDEFLDWRADQYRRA